MGPQQLEGKLFGDIKYCQISKMLFEHELIRKIIYGFWEEIPKQEKEKEALLFEIYHYLFEQKNTTSHRLSKCLSEEFFLTLYGLKLLLEKESLTVVSKRLEAHKNKFRIFLEKELIENKK